MTTLDQQLQQANAGAYAAIDGGYADPRLLALAVEANQRYIEYLEEVQAMPRFDPSVTVKVDGSTIRFENDQQFAEWLAGRME